MSGSEQAWRIIACSSASTRCAKCRRQFGFISFEPLIGSVVGADLTGIHWVIVGGESGPRARPMDPEWVNEIEAMCRNSGIAFFFKQWGGTNKKRSGRLFRGETLDEMPARIA
jgi:protein gp37